MTSGTAVGISSTCSGLFSFILKSLGSMDKLGPRLWFISHRSAPEDTDSEPVMVDQRVIPL